MIQKPTIVKNRPDSCVYLRGGRAEGCYFADKMSVHVYVLGNCSQSWLVTSGKAVAAENGLNSLVETVPATTLMKRAKLRRT